MAGRSFESPSVGTDQKTAENDGDEASAADAYLSPLGDFLVLAALTTLCALALVAML
jgi:hypothetical protein